MKCTPLLYFDYNLKLDKKKVCVQISNVLILLILFVLDMRK